MFLTNNALSIFLAVIVITSSLTFIGVLLARYIYKRIHHLPTGDCACCQINKKKLLKQYHKKYND